MIKTVIFDFYGVFQVDVYTEWLTKNGLTRTGKYDDLVKQLDQGLINRSEFIDSLGTTLGRTIAYEEIYTSAQINQSLVEFVRDLKKHGYRIGLLSNASSELRNKLDTENLTKLFDDITISSEAGVAKPDEKIFQIALKNLGASPSQTIFIDDNPQYIATAIHLGILGIQFTDTVSLLESLKSYDLRI